MFMSHRNSQKRFYHDDAIYFITANTHQKYPYFREEIFCELWLEELRLCKQMKDFELYGFCLLHDHFHMLLKPGGKFDISKIMQSFKKNVSQDINKIMNIFLEGANSNSRFQKVDIMHFRNQFLNKYRTPQYDFPSFQWQKSFHDHIIRDEKDFTHHLTYTNYNFQKHELPDYWKYTAANFPEMIDTN